MTSTVYLETPFDAVRRHAERTPGKAAIIANGETVTYAELARRVDAVVGELGARDVARADLIGVECGRAVENLVGMIGTMAAGAVPLALPNDIAAYGEVLRDSNPRLILATAGGVPEDSEAEAKRLERLDLRQIWESTRTAGIHLSRPTEPEEIAHIYYTSGTTGGVRKGVMQSYRALHLTANYITQVMRTDDTICEYVASPIDNAFWFGRCRCVLKVGGTLLLSAAGSLNPFKILSSISRHGGNAIGGDTPIFMVFLQQMEKHLLRVAPSLKWLKVASQAMPVESKRQLMQLVPNARIVMNYGLTEAMRVALLPFRDFPEKLASVGRPSPGVSVKIVDEAGRELPPGISGEVLISGGNIASGYLRKPHLWRERFDGQWYRSHDLGYLDEDGFLFLQGRVDHAVNVGGKTIALGEVEQRLRPVLTARSFAVCGIDDPNGILGDILVLCVEGDWQEPMPWHELRVQLFERMEASFVPKEAFCISELPRTSNGKPLLPALRRQIQTGVYLRRLTSQPRRVLES